MINNAILLLGLLGAISKESSKGQNKLLNRRDEDTDDNKEKTFYSDEYKIKFEYPSNWNKNPKYYHRYDGPDGFVEIADIKAPNENIDQVVYQDINSPLKPYGSNPEVIKGTVDGQPARVIIPSQDQADYFNKERGVVIKYKKPIKIGDQYYEYIQLWVDKSHLEEILDSFEFLQ